MAINREIPWADPGTPERKRLTLEAEMKIRQGITALMMSAPFFGTLIIYLEIKMAWPEEWPAGCPATAGTDGKKLFVNPMFALTLSHEQICFLLCHEVMHPALGHLARLYDRDPKLWNCAGDYVINNTIDDFSKNTKSQAREWKFIEGGLLDHGHDGKTADQIYDELYKQAQKQPKGGNGQSQQGQGRQQQGNGQGQGQGQQQQQQQQGSGQGSGQDQGGQGVSKEQAMEDVRSGKTQMIPNKDAAGDPTEAQKQEHEWMERLSTAAQTARMQGSMPAGMEWLVEAALKPVLDWKAMLQRFVKSAARNDYRWNRPNRNYISSGLYLPALHSEGLGHVVAIIDDSGSCVHAIPQFLSEVVSIFNEFPGSVLHLIGCDTEPKHLLDWEPGQDEPSFQPQVEMYGGGGTSFVKPFDMIAENEEWNPTCIVYLTDLDGEIPGDDRNPGCPVLWVVNNERHKQDELAFGELCEAPDLDRVEV